METNVQWGFLDRRIETFDPENLLEVIRDGRFDHRLLEGGSFEVRHRRIIFGNSSLDCGDYAPAFAVNGQFSADQICLGFTPRMEKAAWCNGFHVAKEGALSDLADSEALSSSAATSLCEELVNEFVRATAYTDQPSRKNQRDFAGYRFTAMRRAEEFLREHMDAPFSSRGLCGATRMSERSIEMLFKEAYGISPRAWSQIVRLNAARQELLDGHGEDVRVSDVAVRWGFFHFGRFSAAYRNLFGELPSATVAIKRRHTVAFLEHDIG
jgi:AraC-like DNA-binding protein